MNPASRRQTVEAVIEKLGVSERQACTTLGQNRSTQRYELKMPEKDRLLTEAIREQRRSIVCQAPKTDTRGW